MKLDAYYSFIFRGLLTEASLDKAGRRGKLIFSEIELLDIATKLSLDQLDVELVRRSQRMAVVYTAICAFENSVREFISKKLLEEKGEKWWEESVSKPIRDKAESRKQEEEKIRWHAQRGDSIINYTEFSDLITIMAHPNNWKYFEPHISSVEWAKQIVDTLVRSRNVIMHSGELAPRDVERVGTNIRDWISQVG